MAHLDRSTERVQQHLRDYGCGEQHIQTEPGSHGTAVTTVRESDHPWSSATAADIAAALRRLPGANVRLRMTTSPIVVVWDGA